MDKSIFLLGQRRFGWISMAFSCASAWIWAVALLVSSQVTAQYGISGLFWFVIPNAGALMIFGLLATAIRQKYPNGFTLPEFMYQRYGQKIHILYILSMLTIQIFAISIQLIGAGHILSFILSFSYRQIIIGLTTIFLAFTLARGFMPVVWLNTVQMIFLLIILGYTIPMTWGAAIAADFSPSFACQAGAGLGFGIQGALALIAGPPADQQQWQRAFAIRDVSDIRRVFITGGVLFAIVPILQGSLGLLARELEFSGQMAGIETLKYLFPSSLFLMAGVFVATLISSGSNALSAASTIGGTDIGSSVRAARIIMIPIAAIGLGIAILDVPIMRLWLFYGSLRTAIVSVTILAAYAPEMLSARHLLIAVGIGMIVGIPAYLWCSALIGVITLAILPAMILGFSWLIRGGRDGDISNT